MPTYETDTDRVNEQAVRSLLEKKHGLLLHKIKPIYGLDFAGFKDGKLTHFIEVKCRTFEKEKYETTVINAHKVLAAGRLIRTFERKAILVVRWTDFTGWCPFEEVGLWDMGMGGRNDRNDPNDRDLMVYIPNVRFKPL